MGRSLANAEVRPNARLGNVTIRPKDSALFFGDFALVAHINLKSLCSVFTISYYLVTNLPVGLQFTCCTLHVSSYFTNGQRRFTETDLKRVSVLTNRSHPSHSRKYFCKVIYANECRTFR